MAQNIDFSSSDLIQTPQYPEIHLPSQEICDEVFQANHFDQYKENLENSSNSNQEKEEPPQESDMHQLIEECCTKVFYDDDFEDIEFIEASLSDPEIVSIEVENVVQQEEEEVDLEDISQIQDVVLREKSLSITRLISNIECLNNNPTPNRVLNSFASNNSLLNNFLSEFETFCDHTKETRSGNTTHADNSLPEYVSICFKIDPDQERLINLVKNDISDNSTSDPLLEEVDLFLFDNSIPPGIENFADDSEGDIRFWKNYLSMIPFFLMSHLILILRITRQFHYLLRNHQMQILS
nr:hypothetical protein [Tanacetum cinerariifolium]